MKHFSVKEVYKNKFKYYIMYDLIKSNYYIVERSNPFEILGYITCIQFARYRSVVAKTSYLKKFYAFC